MRVQRPLTFSGTLPAYNRKHPQPRIKHLPTIHEFGAVKPSAEALQPYRKLVQANLAAQGLPKDRLSYKQALIYLFGTADISARPSVQRLLEKDIDVINRDQWVAFDELVLYEYRVAQLQPTFPPGGEKKDPRWLDLARLNTAVGLSHRNFLLEAARALGFTQTQARHLEDMLAQGNFNASQPALQDNFDLTQHREDDEAINTKTVSAIKNYESVEALVNERMQGPNRFADKLTDNVHRAMLKQFTQTGNMPAVEPTPTSSKDWLKLISWSAKRLPSSIQMGVLKYICQKQEAIFSTTEGRLVKQPDEAPLDFQFKRLDSYQTGPDFTSFSLQGLILQLRNTLQSDALTQQIKQLNQTIAQAVESPDLLQQAIAPLFKELAQAMELPNVTLNTIAGKPDSNHVASYSFSNKAVTIVQMSCLRLKQNLQQFDYSPSEINATLVQHLITVLCHELTHAHQHMEMELLKTHPESFSYQDLLRVQDYAAFQTRPRNKGFHDLTVSQFLLGTQVYYRKSPLEADAHRVEDAIRNLFATPSTPH